MLQEKGFSSFIISRSLQLLTEKSKKMGNVFFTYVKSVNASKGSNISYLQLFFSTISKEVFYHGHLLNGHFTYLTLCYETPKLHVS